MKYLRRKIFPVAGIRPAPSPGSSLTLHCQKRGEDNFSDNDEFMVNIHIFYGAWLEGETGGRKKDRKKYLQGASTYDITTPHPVHMCFQHHLQLYVYPITMF